MSEEPRSPWLYVGLSCGGCALLIGVVAMITVIGGLRFASNVERELEDPVAREEKARKLLGTDRLPDGYHAVITFSIPFVFETVILADRPPKADHGLADDTEKLFVYVELIRGDRKWKNYASGDGDPSEILAGQGIRMESRSEEIGRGEIAFDGATVDYVSQRGTLSVQGDRFDGIATFLFILCEGSKKMRVGVWSNPDPHPGTALGQADYAGTCADPQQIESFLRPFDLCGGS